MSGAVEGHESGCFQRLAQIDFRDPRSPVLSDSRDTLKCRQLAGEWSSQVSVDTVASPPSSDLKLIRADAAEVAVTTGSIVKAFDVVRDVFVRKFAVLVDVLLDPFLLQASEERFGDRIVPAVPFAAHARFESV